MIERLSPEPFLQLLSQNTAEVNELVSSVPADRVNQTEINKWSILQIFEHLLITDKMIYGLMKRPTDQQADERELFGKDKMKHLLIEKADYKAEAPDMLQPKGHVTSLEDFSRQFQSQRQLLAEALIEAVISIDNSVHTHPRLGDMTISDWLYFIVFHNQRHLAQIRAMMKLKQSAF